MLERGIEIVEYLGDAQVGVGVEILGECVALMAQIRLDLKISVERVAGAAVVFQLAPELACHLVV